MSIESRLTALQSKVEEILTIAKDGNGGRRLWKDKDEDPWSQESRTHHPHHHQQPHEEDSSADAVLLSPQAEIRTLELWRSVVAECLGTLAFVFFVCGVSIPWTGHFPPFLSVAFATALAYGALTFRVFPGAHLNPAFTLALTAIKRLSPIRCLLFLTAQAGGAIAGAALLFGLTVPGYQGTLGATTIASHISGIQALGMEFILSFVMTLTFVSDPTNCFPTTAMLLAANLVALPCTGAGLNPVRSLGPAFVMNKWPSHWVFWLGPILGGLMAAYLHTFILRRGKRKKKVRDSPSDGDSLDLPTTQLPSTIPDRLLCERFEPLYGGTRSLYMKPSPILPRPNLHRSQSVYASKRYEFPPKFQDSSAPSSVSNRKTNNTNTIPNANANSNMTQSHCQRHFDPETNYEPLYDRKPPTGAGQPSSLLLSGPPSYESNFFKTYDTTKSNHSTSSHGHGGHHQHQNSTSSNQGGGSHHHHHHHSQSSSHHHREKSDSLVQQQQRERERENQTNRILAQYESAKGLVDVDPKAALKSQIDKSIYYATSEHNSRKQNQNHNHHQTQHLLEGCVDKKLIDTSCENENLSRSNQNPNPPPPPRFRLLPNSGSNGSQQQEQSQSPRYPPSGQNHSDTPTPPLVPPGFICPSTTNDLSRGGKGVNTSCLNSVEPKKPYELLDANCKKLLYLGNSNPCGQQQSSIYSPRLLLAERDSTYSRILEPLLNSKPQPPNHVQQQQQQQQIQQQGNPQQAMSASHSHNNHNHNHNHANGNSCHMSPNDHLTYSYH